jgi:hypothetical protein
MAYIGKRPVDTFPAINAVTSTLIAENNITAREIATNAITSTLIAENNITAREILTGTITSTYIANNAILTQHIDDNQITADQIADDSVGIGQLAGIARGKILYGDSSGNPALLSLGSNGQVLTSDGTDISWGTDAVLTTENVQDIAGGMFTGNTETGITATYQDGDGTVDLVIGTLNQDTTGLAATATALATARTIGGTSFDGTANIAVGLAGTATALATARTIGGTSFDGTANIVPGTSTALATGRTIGMTGDVVWTSPSFDGSGNVTAAGTIQSDAVEQSMIADDAVGADQLATNAVVTASIVAGSVTTTELAANTIATGNIADNAVDGTKIAQNSILTRHIDDGQVTTDQLGADAVTGAKIADDAIDSEHYTDGSIDTAHIADDQVTAAKLANTAVTPAAYGSSSAIPVITIDAQGRITAASTAATSSVLTIAADSGSNDTVTVGTDTFTFEGTANEIETTVSNNKINFGLPTNVTIAGNLTVAGTQTTVSSTTITVADPLVALASGNNAADAVDIGLYGLYDTSGSQDLYSGLFRDASDSGKWKLFKDNQAAPTTTVNTSGTGYAVGTLVATLEGNVTGNLTGNVTGNTSGSSGSTTGNAATATALASARTIGGTSFDGTANIAVGLAATATALATARTLGGVSFDGTANINLPGVNAVGSQNTTGSAATLTSARTIGGVSFDGSANINLPGVNAVGSQNTTGSAATLTSARTIGGVSFDGSANINLPGVNASGSQDTSGTAALATSITAVANNSTDETVYPAFVDGATGTQGIETDTGLTYNPSTGVLTTTSVTGNLTGNVTGNASGTAATVTGGTQASITAAANLVTVGTIGTGVWQGTAIASGYIANNAILTQHIDDNQITTDQIAANTIATANIADNAVDGTKIAQNSILTRHIDDNQITGDQLADDLVLSGTGAIRMPDGTTGQRPGSAAAGMFRYNTTDSKFEGYTDSWGEIGGSSGASTFTRKEFTGDGSETEFTLDTTPSDENDLMVFIEGVYQNQDAYSVSGTTLTMVDAPVSGRGLVTYHVSAAVAGAGMAVNTMTGDNSDTTLTLAAAPGHVNNVQVFFDGVYQKADTYSVSGTTLTFGTAPPTGVLVEARTHAQTEINTFPATGISGLTQVTAAGADHFMIYDATDSALKKALVSDVLDNVVLTDEQAQDIVGAMFTSTNTESGITVTYQDATGDIDLTVNTLNQDTTGLAGTATALATARTIGGTSFDGTANIVPATVTVADTTDTSSYVALFESATGDLGPKTDAAITYNAGTGALTATSFVGALTGNVTGNTSGTAATVTTGAQPNITSTGTLTSFRSTGIDDNADALAITIDSGEQVGIGTTSPDARLDIEGMIAGEQALLITSARNDALSNGLARINITDPNCPFNGLQIDHAGTSAGSGAALAVNGYATISKSARITQATLAQNSNTAAAVAWDARTKSNAYWAFANSANSTMEAPTNPVEGAIISVEIAQGGTAYTMAWNTIFEFAASTAPTVTATANKTDIFSFRYNGSVWQEIGRVQNMAQT